MLMKVTSQLPISCEELHPRALSAMATVSASSEGAGVASSKRQTNDPNRRMGTKTRGSCQACANVKVRCTKERPTCTRCEDRGLTCEYLQSKRPGRVPGSSAKSINPDSATSQQRRKQNSNEAFTRRSPPLPTSGHSQQRRRSKSNNANTRIDLTAAEQISFPSPVSSVSHLELAALIDQTQAQTRFASSPGAVNYGFHGIDNGDGGLIPMDLELDMDHDMSMNLTMDMNTNTHTNMHVGADIDWETLMAQTDWSQSEILCSTHNANSGRADDDRKATSPRPLSPHIAPAPTASGPLSSLAAGSPHLLARVPSTSSTLSAGVRMESLDLSSSSSDRSTGSNTTPCHCMFQALDLVKCLTMSPTDTACTANDTFAQRVSANRQAAEAALAILACSLCVDDRFVLMSLLMATTKVLGRYALAAALCGVKLPAGSISQSGSSISTPASSYTVLEGRSSSDCFNRLIEVARALSGGSLSLPCVADSTHGEWCPQREDVQRVLQELHGVQKLLTQLSKRLQRVTSMDQRTRSEGYFDVKPTQPSRHSNDNQQQTGSGGLPATSLPPDVLSQMEDNLRRNLYLVSAAMRDVLKNS